MFIGALRYLYLTNLQTANFIFNGAARRRSTQIQLRAQHANRAGHRAGHRAYAQIQLRAQRDGRARHDTTGFEPRDFVSNGAARAGAARRRAAQGRPGAGNAHRLHDAVSFLPQHDPQGARAGTISCSSPWISRRSSWDGTPGTKMCLLWARSTGTGSSIPSTVTHAASAGTNG
jgi:hypothetical protein